MNDLITGIKSVIDNSTALDDLGSPAFYPYSVPSNASFPYIGLDTMTAQYWTTLGSVSDGYNYPVRFIVYTTKDVGGSKKSRQITDTLEDLFNKNEFSISNHNVTYCMVQSKSRPFENPEDPDYYYQYIDFKIITERS
jgi:hypothetical protein